MITTATRDDVATERLLATDPTIMVIGRRPNGTYLAYAPQPREYTDGVPQNLWVTEHTTTATGDVHTRQWVTPRGRLDNAELLHSTPTWATWDNTTAEHHALTDTELATLARTAIATSTQARASGWPATPGRPRHAPSPTTAFAVTVHRTEKFLTVWYLATSVLLTPLPRPTLQHNERVPSPVGHITIPWDKKRSAAATLVGSPETGEWVDHRPMTFPADMQRAWGAPWDPRTHALLLANEPARLRIRERQAALAALDQEITRRSDLVVAQTAAIERAWGRTPTAQSAPFTASMRTTLLHALSALVDADADAAGLTVGEVLTRTQTASGQLPEALLGLAIPQ